MIDEAVELEAELALIPEPDVTTIGPTAGDNQVEIIGMRLTEASQVEFGENVRRRLGIHRKHEIRDQGQISTA